MANKVGRPSVARPKKTKSLKLALDTHDRLKLLADTTGIKQAVIVETAIDLVDEKTLKKHINKQ